ncbi:hypothetical protein ES703_88221 [subsurface metagenome]
MILTEGPGQSHIVLSKGNNGSAIHETVTGHHSFRRYLSLVHTKMYGAVLDKYTYLAEGARVKEIVYSLPGCPLSPLMAPFNCLSASHLLYFLPLPLVFLD